MVGKNKITKKKKKKKERRNDEEKMEPLESHLKENQWSLNMIHPFITLIYID